MSGLTHSLNNELPEELHFDKYAQQILQNSRTSHFSDTTHIALASSSPSISSFEPASSPDYPTTTSEFLKKLGATLIHSIQLQSLPRANSLDTSSSSMGAPAAVAAASAAAVDGMDLDFGPHHLVMDSSHNYNNAMDELQKQLEYDKFMNEVWIGVVLTLILISMIFCFCSCFLYHQFRVWKRNYRTTVTHTSDVEAVKLNLDLEDPVPEYTLVSGLPSYEAALELLHKKPTSCLLVHPTVFEVFNKNEKPCIEPSPPTSSSSSSLRPEICANTEVSIPLLNDTQLNKATASCYNDTTVPTIPSSATSMPYNHSLASLLSLATQITTQCITKSNAAPTACTTEPEKPFKA